MNRRSALAGGLFAVLLGATSLAGSVLTAPTPAVAGVNGVSVSLSEAEIVASAFDGGGPTSPVTRKASDSSFSTFLKSVNIRDRNVDSGRSGRGAAFQDTEILEEGSDLLGLDSHGTADARLNDPDPGDSLAPFGTGSSHLDVTFEVTGGAVKFSLTGDLSTSTASVNQCTEATATSPDGTIHNASSPGGCGSPSSVIIEETGELQPGSRTLSVDLLAPASGGTTSSAEAEYDIVLRFCTITIAQPGLTTQGTAGDDVICGTSGDDTILGLGGKDRIFGLAGEDSLDGGNDADTIEGGAGDDIKIYGGPGNDTIEAGPGDDGLLVAVAGGPGNDEIDGGPGNDLLLGRCGESVLGSPSPICPGDPPVPGEDDDDKLVGRGGQDSLRADLGTNVIIGGDGPDDAIAGDLGDTLAMGDGADTASGGAGRDTLAMGDGADTASGGADNDDIEGGPGNDVEGLDGLGGNDTITGGPGNDLLGGNDGNDTLEGEGGSDTLEGNADGDCLVGGGRKDDLLGDTGNDKLLAKDGEKDRAKGGPGPDRGRFDRVDNVSSVANRSFQGGC